MAGQRFKSRAGLVRGVIGLMLLVLVLALIAPVLAQRGRGRRRGGFPNAGTAPAAGTNAGGQTNAGGGRRGGGRRNRGGNGGFTGGVPRLPGRFIPAPKVEGGGPVGPTIAAPTTFRVLLPQDGATVRGVVDVQVPAANMPAGSYVSFAVNELNGFKYATIRTPSAGVFDWKWDTRELAPGTDTQLYRDGNYTLYAFAHDPTGREMDNGQAQITLTVKNSLTVPGPVRLSYRLPLGDEHIYQSDYSLSVHQATPTANVPKITGMARWAVTVDDYDRADEVAAVSALFTDVSAEDQVVMNNGRLVPGTWNATFFQDLFSQHSGSFELTTDGQRLTPLGRPGPYDYARVGLAANTYIPLPDQPVTVNSSWRGPLTIWTIGNHNHRTRIGSSVNTLIGFEWLDNIKTAKIKTDYSVSLPPPGQPSPVAAGAQLGNMASSFGGAAAQTPVLATGQLTAERITWFDYENGRVLRAVDTRQITNLPSLFVEEGGAAASGGGGYPGAGGGGYPGAGAGAATTPAADLSWLPGFGFSSAAAQQAAVSGAAGFGGGFSGGGYPGMGGGGYPGFGGGGYPGMAGGGYPGFGGGYPGVAGGGFPGGVAGTEGDLGGKPTGFGGGYPGMAGGGYPGFGGGGYPGFGGGGYPGFGGGYPGAGGYPGFGGGYPGMGGGYPGAGGGYPGFGGGFGGGVGTPFGAVPTAPAPTAGGTFQVAGPPKFDEIIDTRLLTGQQASGTES